jgi:hypothetical protein
MSTDARIEAKGELRLGRALRLIREIPHPETTSHSHIRVAPPSVLGPHHAALDVPPSSGVESVATVLRFEEEDEVVSIRDDGLCQSFGIFGKPGCGKTYLLKHLLGQILRHPARFGGLILDPKAALLGDIQEVMQRAGRESDLVVINDLMLARSGNALNVIDASLDATSLGKALGLALKGAGITSKEPYWNIEVSAILGAAMEIHDMLVTREGRRATLAELAQTLLHTVEIDGQLRPMLRVVMQDALLLARKQGLEDQLESARSCLMNYLESKDHGTLRSFIHQGFGEFTRPDLQVFSSRTLRPSGTPSLYDATLEEGKVILVSLSKRKLSISRVLCTLVKTLFQVGVLTRLERHLAGEIRNYNRPLFFMVDEYSDVATDGDMLGDPIFFSQMRQFGCMGLVATQSVHMLESSALGESWKALYSNLAAKIFFALADGETAEEGTKLAGQCQMRVRAFDRSFSKDGTTMNARFELRNESALLTDVFLRGLARGEGIVIGTLDGKERAAVRFFKTGG